MTHIQNIFEAMYLDIHYFPTRCTILQVYSSFTRGPPLLSRLQETQEAKTKPPTVHIIPPCFGLLILWSPLDSTKTKLIISVFRITYLCKAFKIGTESRFKKKMLTMLKWMRPFLGWQPCQSF